jgi:hypothetical protein
MQLLSWSLKAAADDMLKLNFHDQFSGGRWVPEYNIMVGAEYLRSCLKTRMNDSGRDQDMWLGVAGYEQGANYKGPLTPYAQSVYRYVKVEPNFLKIVVDARQTSAQTTKQQENSGPISVIGSTATGAEGPANSQAALTNLSHLHWGSNVSLSHVNYDFLQNINSLAAKLGKTIEITSGYRPTGQSGDLAGAAGLYGGAVGGDTQWYLWNQYRQSGFSITKIAASPGTSNHEKGLACDCTVGGQPIKKVVSASLMAQFHVHGTVDGDWPHITPVGVSG